MCQLNLYCVPKTITQQSVIELMNEVFGYTLAENIDEEQPIPSLSDKYSFYISGGMRCNCGSALCSEQEFEGLSWEQVKERHKSEKIEKLIAVKEILEAPDYSKKRKEFEKSQAKLYKKINVLSKDIQKTEQKLTKQLFDRKDIGEQEKNYIYHNEIMPKVNGLMEELNNSPEYKSAMADYQEFISKNNLIWDCMFYSLERTSPKNMPFIEANDMFSNNSDTQIIEIEMPSNCIYDAIEKAKNENYEQVENEFAKIKQFADKILKQADKLKIFCYWQDGAKPTVIDEKSVPLKSFNISDAVFLQYNQLLTITK